MTGVGMREACVRQVLRRVQLAAHVPRRHAVSCTSSELVVGAHTGEASPSVIQSVLMVQHVFPSSSLLRCSKYTRNGPDTCVPRPRQRLLKYHEGQIKLSFANFHWNMFMIDEVLHEQNEQQLASEFLRSQT